MDGQRWVRIGPEIFINPPYIRCPKCGHQEFGVLGIYEDSYLRRCANCYYPRGDEPAARFLLPTLEKKVIYLDQMAISAMMKAINPETEAHKRGALDQFWQTLFRKLDILCKLQVAVCPASESHKHESLLSPFFKALNRMYEHLSGGITFYYHEEIHRFQISVQFQRWMGDSRPALTINEITRGGKINAWQDRMMISFNIKEPEGLVEELMANRKKTEEGLAGVFNRWRSEADRDFDDWQEEESEAAAEVLMHTYHESLRQFSELQSGLRFPDMADLFPPMSVILFSELMGQLKSSGYERCDAWKKLMEFLKSKTFREMPFTEISSLIYAAVARKAAKGGQKGPPNRGFATVVKVVASLLPYCDAMFIDNQVRALLLIPV